MSLSSRPARSRKSANNDTLVRAITCTLIGVVILLGQYFARSASVQELMGQMTAIGWLALLLGVGFFVRYFMQKRKAPAKKL